MQTLFILSNLCHLPHIILREVAEIIILSHTPIQLRAQWVPILNLEGIQWNPSIPDTLGTSKSVQIMGVSSFQGYFWTKKAPLGLLWVSWIARCPHFRGVHSEGFHCTCTDVRTVMRLSMTTPLPPVRGMVGIYWGFDKIWPYVLPRPPGDFTV